MQISNNAINFNTSANLGTNLPPPQSKSKLAKALKTHLQIHKELDSTSKMMNKSFIELKRIYDEATKDIPILEGSLEDRIQKGENIDHRTIANEMEREAQAQVGGLPIFDLSRWDEIRKDYAKALRTSKSLDEFKENYRQVLDKHIGYFKETWAEYDRALQEQLNQATKATQGTNSINSSNGAKTENASKTEESENSKKAFTPIQAKSSRETYSDTSTAKNLELTKIEQVKDVLDILFNQKAGENSALKGLFTTQTRKVDIKA